MKQSIKEYRQDKMLEEILKVLSNGKNFKDIPMARSKKRTNKKYKS